MQDPVAFFSSPIGFPDEDGDAHAEADAGAPPVSPEPRSRPSILTLLPSAGSRFSARERTAPPDPAPQSAAPKRGRSSFLAASAFALTGVIALGGAGALFADHRDVAGATQAQLDQSTTEALKRIGARLDALEAQGHAETPDKKLAGDVRTALAATRDLSGAIGQLGARIDKLDRDQTARVEKLAERLDKDSPRGAGADKSGRTASLEVTPAPVQPNGEPAVRPPAPVAAKPPLALSNDVTGSIDKPRPPLPGFAVLDVRDGVALLQTHDGPQEVSPGDFLPGAGRIERIEKRARGWMVVTSLGTIQSQ